MGNVIKNETIVERNEDMIRVTRIMVEDLGPEEYIDNLNALINKVNKYAEDLKHDTHMRDAWMDGRIIALKIRDEIFDKHKIDKKEIPDRKIQEIKGGFDTFQKDQLKRKTDKLTKSRGGK